MKRFLPALLLAAALVLGGLSAQAEDMPQGSPAPAAGQAAQDTSTDDPSQEDIDEPTDEPTDGPTENPTDGPTENPTDGPTDGPTENPTDGPTENPTDGPTDGPTEQPTDKPTDQPTDGPTENPTNGPTDGPTENPTDKPTDGPEVTPTPTPEDQPHAGHTLTLRLSGEVRAVPRSGQQHALVRNYELYCEDCGEVIAQTDQTEETLEEHTFPESGWRLRKEATCAEPGEEVNVCAVCGQEAVRGTPLKDHQWTVVSMQEPTCTEPGLLVRVCAVCGQEERVESPAMGHVYEWVKGEDGIQEYKCVVCGDVKAYQTAVHDDTLYNNTITSFGPTTRELIGGTVWNRVTPMDVSQEGIFTYPLIASNSMSVGTATVEIENGFQTVSYQLNSHRIAVHSESLVIYPSLDSLRTGADARAFEFNVPIDLKENFGDDTRLIMAITLKADYSPSDPKLQRFNSDDEQIILMNDLID